MNFFTVTNVDGDKVVLNVDNIVSFHVTHPREDSVMTKIETTSFGCRYYVEGDITKELSAAVKACDGHVTTITKHA